jgi:signal transduction histidine kinase
MSRDGFLLGVAEALPHALSVVDAEDRLAYANPAYWRYAGIDPSLCPIGTDVADLIRMLAYRGLYGPGDPEAQARAVLALDRSRPLTRHVRTADGARVFELSSQPLPGGGWISSAHDITLLQRATTEAQGRARLFETVLQNLSGGIVAYDAEYRVTLSNPAYAALTGLPAAEVRPGVTHRDLLALQEARGELVNSAGAEAIAERMERERAIHAVRQRERPGGEVLRFESHPLPDGGLVVEVGDITALKRAEDEARRRAALLDGVLEALPHGVVVFGPDRRAAMHNAAYQRIMGEAGARIGETVDELVARRRASGEYDEATAGEVLLRYSRTREGDAAATGGMRRVRPDGTAIDNRMARLPDGGFISVFTDITPLHRAEEEARSRAELLDAVLEALPDGVVVYGPDRRARVTNAAYRRILGSAAVRIGESLEELRERRVAAGEFTRGMGNLLMDRHLSPEVEVGRPIRRLRPDGTAIVTRAGRLPDGGHIAVITDETALHRAEEELGRRAAMLEASFAAIRHGIAIFGADRRLLAANARIGDLTGVPRDFFAPGRAFDELIDEQERRGIITPAQAVEARARDRARPHRVSREMGAGRVMEVFSDPTADGGFVLTFADITALRRAEEEAARRSAMLEAMLGNISHGIIMYGPDRRVLATNDKTAELCGMPADSLPPGRLMDEVLDEQVRRGQIAPGVVEGLKAADRSRPLHYTRTRPDGRVIDVVSEPTPDGSFVLTFTDVTEDRRIRAELEAARAAAEAGSAAKSRFLATMSHELRTPLNAVIGFSEAIAGERDRQRVEEYAGAINEAGKQLLLLIDDILEVARSQTGALSPGDEAVGVGPLLQGAVRDAAAAAAAAGLSLQLSLPPHLPALRADPRRLSQILGKLLSNAVKFTPYGGDVILSAETGPDGLAIRVADTGIGIPAEDRERSFEPFTQLESSLSRRYQGSGLGLHLARTLAAALGGTLTLEDPADGPGLVAVLRFPPARLVMAGEPAALEQRISR